MIDNYETFKKQVYSLTGIDLNSYKENQMKRRIDSLISRSGCKGYSEYAGLLRDNRDKFDEFVNYLTINVSEFWRNPEQWDILEKKILPQILEKGSVKIWSAACSTGDEPYSVVMLLSKYVPLSRIMITATDIDKQILMKAKAGIYTGKSLKGLPTGFKTKFFSELSKDTFEIKEEIKRCVTFKEQNLLGDQYPLGFDLIICRNVLIYFTDEAKDKIYLKFNRSLNNGGFLFLGSTEQILSPQNYGFTPVSSFFYKKQ